jgi:hypothetical protein
MNRVSIALSLFFVLAQANLGSAQEGKQRLNEASANQEDPVHNLMDLHERIANAENDGERNLAHEVLTSEMISTFKRFDFWETDTDSLSRRIGVVSTGQKENRVAIITWNVEYEDRTNAYGGLVITRDKRNEQVVTPLLFKGGRQQRQELNAKNRFTSKNWPGAIYYDILVQNKGSHPVYTLLGWDGADGLRNRKIVETMIVSGNRVKFGIPIIDVGRGSVKRHVLEYSDAVSTTLQWREDMGMIVMDHLSPSEPAMKDFTAFYGPDFSYDGFYWHRNHWVLKEDIEVRDTEMKVPWNNPKKWRRRSRN